jgi:hypothetical protein
MINEINYPRNGLLLATAYGWMAFKFLKIGIYLILAVVTSTDLLLQTPNFVLLSQDVPPSTWSVSGPSGRLTCRYFMEPDPATSATPHNQDTRRKTTREMFRKRKSKGVGGSGSYGLGIPSLVWIRKLS